MNEIDQQSTRDNPPTSPTSTTHQSPNQPFDLHPATNQPFSSLPSASSPPSSRSCASSAPDTRPSASSALPSRPSASTPPTSQTSVSRPSASSSPSSRSIAGSAPNSRPSASSSPPSRPSPSTPPTNRPSATATPTEQPTTHQTDTNPTPMNQTPVYNTAARTNIAPNSHPTTGATHPEQETTTPPAVTYQSVPYVQGLTERIAKMFSKDYPQVILAARQYNTVSKFHTNVKDPKSKKDTSNIVYNMPCNNCACCYIGMTQNKLIQRLAGHQTHVSKLETLLTSNASEDEINDLKNKTSMIEHCIMHEHRFNFDKTKIVDRSNNTKTLAFLEMCHIYNTPNTVNRRNDIDNLNTAYAAILHTIKTRSINAHQ